MQKKKSPYVHKVHNKFSNVKCQVNVIFVNHSMLSKDRYPNNKEVKINHLENVINQIQ